MGRKSKKSKSTAKVEELTTPVPWTTSETRGFLTLAFVLVIFLSLMSFAIAPDSRNLLGVMGHTLGWAFHAIFGLASYGWVAFMAWIGWRQLFSKPLKHLWLKSIYVFIAVLSLCLLLSLIESDFPSLSNQIGLTFYPGLWMKHLRYHLGGAPAFYIYQDLPGVNLNNIFNTLGAALIFSSTLIASLLFLFKVKPLLIIHQLALRFKSKKAESETGPAESQESDFLRFVKLRIPTTLASGEAAKTVTPPDMLAIQPEKNLKIRPSLSRKEQSDSRKEQLDNQGSLFPDPAPVHSKKKELIEEHPEPKTISDKSKKREAALTSQIIHNGDFTNFQLPSLNLIHAAKKIDQSTLKKDLKRQAEVLEETLLSFGIEAKVGQINCGPTITSFEVHPAIGVKVQKIKTLDNDIALNMEAKSIRIIAPIPGKAAVGIEVPNSQPQEVGFKDMLNAYQQSDQKFHIPILLGKAVNGDYVMSDLAKMPHCIIAGATGSGKSVCINTIVMSILLNAKPDQIKLIMVDPKKVELTPYTMLPHMLAPVITEPQGAAAALNWLVKEMENRYDILKSVGCAILTPLISERSTLNSKAV